MPVSDPIGDMLTRMRNAQHVRSSSCVCPWSRHKEEICDVLKREGFIADVSIEGEGKDKIITITFSPEYPKLALLRVSAPGRRLYSGKSALRPVLSGFGIAVLTTSKGVLSDREAKAQNVGGEILCTIS
ncbi:MAG TPA: 30S ribosomal protein S8 [Candidatus Peribacterales bacterium]|nr:30S ribosomal protein S8 [Candidatus Peribacterales bacterium]